MSNGYDTAVQKYSGTTHVFTSRSRNDTITLRAGNGETLVVDGTMQAVRAPRVPISFDNGTSIDVSGTSISLAGTIRITNTTASTSSTNGALVVSGGMGIAGNLYVAGTIYAGFLTTGQAIADTLVLTSATIGALSATGATIGTLNVSNANIVNLHVSGNLTAGSLSIGTATATSLTVSTLRPQYNYNYELSTCRNTSGTQTFTTGTPTIMTLFNSATTGKPSYVTSSGLTNSSTNTVDVTTAGVFLVNAVISFVPDANFRAIFSVYHTTGSVLVSAVNRSVVSGTNCFMSCSGIAVLTAATDLKCYFEHNKGSDFVMAALNLNQGFNFTVTRIASI